MTTDPRPAPPRRDPAAPAGPLLEQRFDAGSLYALRAAVAAHAAAAGLSRQRVYDVTAAVHEMAANAVLHGAGHGHARLWAQDGFLHCEVSDDGPARRDDRATPPRAAPWPAEHGHGRWIVAKVADTSSTDHGPAGTTVTIRFALSPPLQLAHRASRPGDAPEAPPGTHAAARPESLRDDGDAERGPIADGWLDGVALRPGARQAGLVRRGPEAPADCVRPRRQP